MKKRIDQLRMSGELNNGERTEPFNLIDKNCSVIHSLRGLQSREYRPDPASHTSDIRVELDRLLCILYYICVILFVSRRLGYVKLKYRSVDIYMIQ